MTIKLDPLESGQGIQVVTPDEDHNFILDEEALASLLLKDDIKDRAVVLISVAGAFRKGKSFLLDFFLRYMQHRYNEPGTDGEWLGPEDQALRGFKWRGGSERHTTGLLLWSQPFKATLASGEKVVIFLMDTQGTFDSESTVRDCATVFALSTMLSSVQIYNLSQNIQEDDLQHLQLFTEYGRLALESGGRKPFQRLQFLVRDWSFPEDYEYGDVGGKALLAKILKPKGRHLELQGVRQHIEACFEDLSCFLMPHPGLTVANDPKFKGKLSDIRAEFKDYLNQLVPKLLSPENLVPKLINGQRVRAKDLLHYFKCYVNIFNAEKLPEPKTIWEATAEANHLTAVSEARTVYTTLMEEVCGGTKPYVRPARLQEEHVRAKDKALHEFHNKPKMGGEEYTQLYGDQLTQELEEKFKEYSENNEAKNIFKLAITPIVLLATALLASLLGTLGASLGLQALVAVGHVLAVTALAMLAVWAYSRISGNMRELGIKIDEVAGTVRDTVTRQAVGYALNEKKSS